MYDLLDTKKTNELCLVRHGWFSPEYELTGNAAGSYGKLSYNSLSRRKATAVTAACSWTFKRESFFSRTILIIDQNGVTIGEATRDFFSRRTILTMQTGFRAEFYRPSIWSREYIWESEGYGKVLHINCPLLSLKRTVFIDQSMTPAALIPLLIFLGAHLTILRKRRRAAHY
jgi:hypothetical protein